MRKFIYRLFFTRDDDLDMLQIMFLLCVAFFFLSFAMEGSGKWANVSSEGWTMFKWVFGILALAGTPAWIATLIGRILGDNVKSIFAASIPKNSTNSIVAKPNGNDPEGESES